MNYPLCNLFVLDWAGKTTFCNVLLREISEISNNGNNSQSLSVSGSVAYASQQSWIQHATVRNNILMNQRFEEQRYNEVVMACCLDTDFCEWPLGDQTLVGEKGLNLSGGTSQIMCI